MKNSVLQNFKSDYKIITDYYKKLINKTRNNEIIGSINEWIVDNYYIVSEQEKFVNGSFKIDNIKKISNKRKNKIYDEVRKIIKGSDFKVNQTNLFNQLNEYQVVNNDYFSYAEIDYIHVILRVVLVSELAKLSISLNNKLSIKNEIDNLFNKINSKLDADENIDLAAYISLNKKNTTNAYYIEQLNYKLKELGKLSTNVFIKLNENLNANNISLKEIIRQSHDEMSKNNVVMMNSVNSLKNVTKYKIEFIYKNISFAEKTLMGEDENIYDDLFENSKFDYRKQIIKYAKKKKTSEYDYAMEVVEKANADKKHVGWYLFKKERYSLRTKIYIAAVVLSTLIASYIVSISLGLGLFIILLIPMSNLMIEIINKIISLNIYSRSLFKIKFEEGLPECYSSMVVIPTLVKDAKKINQMFDKLEVYYLSNKTDNLYFTLLADCSSEEFKTIDADELIKEAGLKKVKELNEKYGRDLFYFVYRSRFYNEGEDCYLGFERKRGALNHFNKLLLGKLSESEKNDLFYCHTFNNYNLPIKYVITLDTDTKLVLNTALKLIGTMAHPMNRPVLSDDGKRVVSGYGIMQPRINVDIEVTNKSKYSQLFAGLGGLDIYTMACFDLYQDAFNEGSFVGKGIYDLEIFEELMENTFPNNLILSHDLIEGNYLRCGFINDIELFDDYPSNYLSDASRHHRWTRGDWQIISWLKRKVRNLSLDKVNNPITLLGKWKIFDNLRRSLVSFFLLLIIIYGFSFGEQSIIYYILLDLLIIAIPILFYLLSKLVYRSKYDRSLKYYLQLLRGFLAVANKSLIVLALLPYEAYLYIDAIVKALYRMLISHKRLLNWITAEEMEKTLKNTLSSYLKAFKTNYFVSIFILVITYLYKPEDIYYAIALALVWILAPILMYRVSRSIIDKENDLTEEEQIEIKDLAFKTWRYFDDLITDERNYLVPDNYQYNREEKADYKTSPTNIGYSLLATISAFELGFISEKKATTMIGNIIDTVCKLKKWNGHLYNWYDIYSLRELAPYFVSSVDNGNFIATLFTVKGFLIKHNDSNILPLVENLINEMDFTKLYDFDADVFTIGYNDSDKTLLPYNYNNFASESRLTSFIAIAKGDAPYKHWFCLDKTLTKYKKYKGVASWSGTAFEYFMPLIFMPTYKHTLLDETYFYALYCQKEFIHEIDPKLPWGISESAYNELDDAQNYKYNAFGIPYLKFQDSAYYPIVISPYSSALAIGIDDREVYNNFNKLKDLDMVGEYGFYEAYDKEDNIIIKNHYAHHQGMILASLTNYLKENVIQDYFMANKKIAAIEMLLKEKVQIRTYIDLKIAKYKRHQYNKERQETDLREYDRLKEVPEMGVLSNGLYTIVLNDRGTGLSKYKNLYINRHRDITEESYGMFLYIKNLNNNKVWSNTYAPLNIEPDRYKAILASDRVKYIREDDGIITNTEITVVKDHNAELRKVTFKNMTNEDVTLEVTSYGEVIMCRNEDDIAHRAFNSIMIDSEIDETTKSLIFSRNSRTKEDTKYFVINRLFTEVNDDEFEYETSRYNFIGRNRNTSNPIIMDTNVKLSNSIGAALDPIMSIRKKIIVKAKSKETVYMVVGFGKSKEQIMEIVNTYNSKFSVDKAFDITTVFNNMRTSYANLTGREMCLYNTMLNCFYQTLPMSKQREELLLDNKLSQSGLWKFGVSGDLPIILVEIDNVEEVGFINEVLQAYEFYKSRALYIDIIIINNEKASKEDFVLKYIDNLMYRINNLNYFENSPGGVYTISDDDINKEEKTLLKMVSKIYLNASSNKTLEEQVLIATSRVHQPIISKHYKEMDMIDVSLPANIDFNNKYGGFINQGKEYIINENNTPTPWSNVIANNNFGFVITNNGAGFTYYLNSREFKLTAWSDDPVADTISEKIIINNELFIPTNVKHGFGYTKLYGSTKQFDLVITVFVPLHDSVKLYDIEVKNKSGVKQKLSIKFVCEMVLGASEELTNRYILTNEKNNALYMKNVYSEKFKHITTFMSSSEKIENHNYKEIVNNMIEVEVDVTNDHEFAFMLGAFTDDDISNKYRNINKVKEALAEVKTYWETKLSVINVSTPDKALNYALNGWYLYQAYASRLFAKAGFYQVGGATGFRDQLQDVMSVLYSDPAYAKHQILFHANHQFKEGDVLHWWHEEVMFGSRTKFTDDYLWLVYVTYEYIKVTNDYGILDELVGYVDGDKLCDNENEKGITYHYIEDNDTLYNHLKLCINKSLTQFGTHHIPLIGSGDWNDGFNKVGREGKGESVFVGFFLYDLLQKMSEIALQKNDNDLMEICLKRRELLKEALNSNAWDGAWYLRAFFDNGDPVGSRNNLECQIDLVSQSWSILSDVITKDRIDSVIKEVDKHLVDKEMKIIKLLTPGFKNSVNNPGYIKDYIIGTRENGGQYTHAALWYVLALLKLNKVDKAYEYYQMLNPINRGSSFGGINTYKVEPYVIAADVYSNSMHPGRGGWTWYTGSAAWAYKIGLEEIIGFKKYGDKLYIEPKIDKTWDDYTITYKYMDTMYHIEVINNNHLSSGKSLIKVDEIIKEYIDLVNDKKDHKVIVEVVND